MAHGIFDFTELVLAINEASGYTTSVKMATDEVRLAYAIEGVNGVFKTAEGYGLRAVTDASGNFMWWSTQQLETATVVSDVPVYAGALDTAIEETSLVVRTPAAVTTSAGSTVASGGVATATKVLPLVGAVVTGCQLGWNSYKNHPTFWEDFSKSIGEGLGEQALVLNKLVNGEYTSYVQEKEVAKAVEILAKKSVFPYNIQGSTYKQTDDVGIYDATFSNITAMSVSGTLAEEKLKEFYGPNITILQNNTTRYKNDNTRVESSAVYGMYTVEKDKLPDEVYTEFSIKTNNTKAFYSDINANQYGISTFFYVSATVNKDGGVRYSTPSGWGTVRIYSGDNKDVIETDEAFFDYQGGLNVISESGGGNYPLIPVLDPSLTPNIGPNTSYDDIVQELRRTYPQWFNDNAIDVGTYNPTTGEVEYDKYIPVGYPPEEPFINDKPATYTPEDVHDGRITPDNAPQILDNPLPTPENVPTPTPTPTPTTPDTPEDPGGGGTGGSSNALYSVYNPTTTEIHNVGSYLWSDNIITVITKMFQNPLDAIISLHIVYCTPSRGSRKNIKLGYLDTGVSAVTVPEQFNTIDCGSLRVNEFYNDARDYSAAYTSVQIYLPFIGIKTLSTADVVGSVINVVYTIDVFTGAVLCKIFISKNGSKKMLYCFSGNCSVQVPLTGADRTRLLSGAISGAGAGFAVGGPIGAAVGAVAGGFTGGVSLERSGQFSANSGAMGIKIPYLIITRKNNYDAGNYNKYYGFPSNVSVNLSRCSGYTRVKDVHVDNINNATENEKREIESILKSGIII